MEFARWGYGFHEAEGRIVLIDSDDGGAGPERLDLEFARCRLRGGSRNPSSKTAELIRFLNREPFPAGDVKCIERHLIRREWKGFWSDQKHLIHAFGEEESIFALLPAHQPPEPKKL